MEHPPRRSICMSDLREGQNVSFPTLCDFYRGMFLIAYKELFPVVIAAHVWRSQWSKRHVLLVRSDNETEVAILSSGTSKVSVLMHLLRDLLLWAALWGLSFNAAYVRAVDNKIADSKSRFHLNAFQRLSPEAQVATCPFPQLLLNSSTA